MRLKEAINHQASHKEQVEAYSAIVKARKLWQNSIVNTQREYSQEQRILKKRMTKRVKNSEGEMTSPMDIYNNRMEFMIGNRKNLTTLQSLQSLERKIMNALGASIGIIPDTDLQDITFFIPAE